MGTYGVDNTDYEQGQSAGQTSQELPKGQRGIFPNQLALGIIKDGWVTGRDNPNDRIIGSTLDEDISGASRTSITVAPLNFAMSSGEKIWIQTGDPSTPPLTETDVTPAYLTADAAQGVTTLSIDDGNGNPVTITASQGDRVLSNDQSPWIIHAKENVKDVFGDYMQGFVDAGGEADVVFTDFESGLPTTERMAHDPRWDDSSIGLNGKSLKQVVTDGPYTETEIFSGNDDAERWFEKSVLTPLENNALNEALFDVAQSYFPDITGSDYNHTGITEQNKVLDTDGGFDYKPYVFGTHGSHPLYASIRSLAGDTPGGIPNEIGKHPFAVTLWQVQYVRAMHRSNNGKVMPWLTYEGLIDAFFALEVRQTPYYEEHVRHMALHTDSDVPVLYWNARDGGGGGGDDQQDLNFNSVLEELNGQISADTYQTVTTQEVGYGDDLIATAIETPNKRLWRVTIERTLSRPGATLPQSGRDIAVNVSNGDTVVIPSGKVGTWYETAKGVDVTFSYQKLPVDNLLPNDNFLDFTSSKWVLDGTDPVQGGISDPDGGTDAYKATDPFHSAQIPVEKNTDYVFSVWSKKVSGNYQGQITGDDYQNDIITYFFYNFEPWGNRMWKRRRVFFNSGDRTVVRINFPKDYAEVHFYQPMLNKGRRDGPYTSPEAPSPGSQQISLQKGGNLVSTNVDPTYPDLETVLGDARSSIARVVTQDDQVFDPSEGTDEIGTWDPTEAYTIYAEEPTSFVVGGTVLGSKDVSLDAGWNWLPHLGSTSVPVDQAFDTIQNDLVMVKDETGRVYRPAQDTDQIGSLQPGTAYKILLENPVVLSYPLE
ncbi:hypothetical protein [Salinibacter ruber]|uniref:hypothetical protein n=1 Tax=Salinibacter ruber TaxID=146919 RepID=UPI0021699326|nr:hypothetical protein [Salinibacter ruber]MCS4040844.1 hypothetical protein [Salinibacter ruber]